MPLDTICLFSKRQILKRKRIGLQPFVSNIFQNSAVLRISAKFLISFSRTSEFIQALMDSLREEEGRGRHTHQGPKGGAEGGGDTEPYVTILVKRGSSSVECVAFERLSKQAAGSPSLP